MGDLLVFKTGENSTRYRKLFHHMICSCGKPDNEAMRLLRKTMITFFINCFLTMSCLSSYNETNINRLLVNYDPSKQSLPISDRYQVLKKFKNLYWAESMLKNWSSYSILRAVYSDSITPTVVSFADLVLFVLFSVAANIVSINPKMFREILFGKPFYIRDLICRYWFLHGLSIRDVYEYKFHHVDFLVWRKKQYMRECSAMIKQ